MTSTRTTRLTRTTLAAIAAGGLLTAGGLGAALAPAHTPAGSASCSGITGRMTNAPEDFTSTITLYVDGNSVGSETAKGNHSISRDVPQDYDTHTWKVVVDAGQYSGRESGSFGPCKQKPSEPTSSHTPEPTSTPTSTPTPTDTPTSTPTPTGTPTPTSTPSTPTDTSTPDIGTPTSSTAPPAETSTPKPPKGDTPNSPADNNPPADDTPDRPKTNKPPVTELRCQPTDTDRNADCQPDVGGPRSNVVEEGF